MTISHTQLKRTLISATLTLLTVFCENVASVHFDHIDHHLDHHLDHHIEHHIEGHDVITEFCAPMKGSNNLLNIAYDMELTLPANLKSAYDYIIVGGGTCGSVMASRLSRDPAISIALFEAGYLEDIESSLPYNVELLRRGPRDEGLVDSKQRFCCKMAVDSKLPIPIARSIGGMSAIDEMANIRAAFDDADRWNRSGATGWSYNDLLPYYILSEKAKGSSLDHGYHGYRGHWPNVAINSTKPGILAFLEGIRSMGLPIGDYDGENPVRTDFAHCNVYHGKRYSSARSFLAPASFHRNLDVITYAEVSRILFDSVTKTAIGVNYVHGKAYNKENRVYARKGVILCAGAIGTPKLLMLSGIGAKDDLTKLGIKTIVNLPGVGNNFQNHVGVDLLVTTNRGTGLTMKNTTDYIATVLDFLTQRKGYLANPANVLYGFFKSKYPNGHLIDFEIAVSALTPGSVDSLERFRHNRNLKPDIFNQYYGPAAMKDGLHIRISAMHPASRGTVKLTSSNASDPVVIDSRALEDRSDRLCLIEGIKLFKEILRTEPMQEIGAHLVGRIVPCEKYTADSDAFWECFVQYNTVFGYHPVGTTKMGSLDDPMAVVDPYCAVKGVNGLYAAGQSVLPDLPAGHITPDIIAFSWRCADIITSGSVMAPINPPVSDEYEPIYIPLEKPTQKPIKINKSRSQISSPPSPSPFAQFSHIPNPNPTLPAQGFKWNWNLPRSLY